MIRKGKLILSLLGIVVLFFLIQAIFGLNASASTESPINETTFPDNNFVNALKEIYPTYTKDNLLTPEEVSKITSLNLSMQGIRNLKGIEYFTNLTFFKSRI